MLRTFKGGESHKKYPVCKNGKTKRNVVFDCVDYQPLGATYHCNTPLGHHPFISTPVKFSSLFLKLNSYNISQVVYISGCYLFLRVLFLAAQAALYLTLVSDSLTHSLTGCHFRILAQRVTFET